MKLYNSTESEKIHQIYNQVIFLLREQREIINKLTDNKIFTTDLKELIKQQLLDIANQFSYLDLSRYKKATQRCQIMLQKQDNRIHIIYNQEFLIFIMRKLDKYQLNSQIRDLYQDRLQKLIKSSNIDFQYEHKINEKDMNFIKFLSKIQDNLLLDEIEQLAYLIDIKEEQVTADEFAMIVDNIYQEREFQMNKLEHQILFKLFDDDKIKLNISNQKPDFMDPNIQKFIIDSKQIKLMKKYTINKKIYGKLSEKRVAFKLNEYERTVINMSKNSEKGFFIAINYYIAKREDSKSLFKLSKQTSCYEILIHPKLIKDQPDSVIYQVAKEMFRNGNKMLYDIENFYALMEGYNQRRNEKLQKQQALKYNWIGQAQYTDEYFKNMSIYQKSLQHDWLYFNQKNKIQDYSDGIYIDENQNAVIVKQNNEAYYFGNQTNNSEFKCIQKKIPYMSKDLFRFFIYVILTKTQDHNVLYKFLNGDSQTITELIQQVEQDR